MIQAASDAGNAAGLVYFIFDLLHLDGEDVAALPLIERKAWVAELLAGAASPHRRRRLRARQPRDLAQAFPHRSHTMGRDANDQPVAHSAFDR